MKFIKFAILGAALAASVPSAFADRLYGSISVGGNATITGVTAAPNAYPNDYVSKITFSNPNGTKTDSHYRQSPGSLIGSDTSFSGFDSGASVYYVPGATSTTQNASHQYTGRTAAAYSFTAPSSSNGDTFANGTVTYGSPVLAAPVELFTVTEGGHVLVFYLTEIDSATLGLAAKTTGTVALRHPALYGGFTGYGYVTIDGASQTYGTFSLQNSTAGTGAQAFSATFTAPTPEPSSLALIGTGMFGAAGMLFRKRKK